MSAAATETRAGRFGLGMFLSLLMLTGLAAMPASAQDSGFEVNAELVSSPVHNDWYVAGDVISLVVEVENLGPAETLVSNPSCPAILSAYTTDGTMLYDGLAGANCRQQSRGTDFADGESIEWAEIEWDFTDSDGNFVPTGLLTIVVDIPDTNLSTSSLVDWYAPVSVSDSLQLELIPAQTPSGVFSDSAGLIASARLHNTGPTAISVYTAEGCTLRLSVSQNGVSLSEELTDLPCDGGLEGVLIGPAEVRDLGWFSYSFDGVESGIVDMEISLPDGGMSDSVSLDYERSEPAASPALSGENSPLILGNTLSILPDQDGVINTSAGTALGMTGSITNGGEQNSTLTFTNMCRIEMHVLNEDGEIVYDTRDGRNCREVDIDHHLEQGETMSIQHADWMLIDRQGCGLLSGTYTIVTDVPEYRLRSITSIHHSDDGSGISCLAGQVDAPSLSLVDDNAEPVFTQSGIELDLFILNDEQSTEMRWVGPCRLTITIEDSAGAEVRNWLTLCGAERGERMQLDTGSSLNLDLVELQMVDLQGIELVEGEYTISVRLNTWPSAELSIDLNWPIADNVSQEDEGDDSELTGNELDVGDGTPSMVSGTWMYVTTDEGGCWLLNANGKAHLLTDATAVYPWMPQPRTTGTYQIIADDSAAPECADWDNHISILNVVNEQTLPVEGDEDSAGSGAVSGESSIIEEAAPAVIAVVVSTSILSLLAITLVSNEAWRIPATQFGLTLIGLIGRTHETNDGKFQRGRLMGYLTANPGCHFRALMAALEMSNGQITHHLKVLEEEENIWRKKDGRLVRYYPTTIAVNTPSDELPIPALSPDSNSLQGKILRLLDHDGQMDDFPTQAELAERLKRSQQLISHHLRTLQKYGLVEKRRSGVRNRYHLTKEAVFLLNNPQP